MKLLKYFIYISFLTILVSCQSYISQIKDFGLSDGKYDKDYTEPLSSFDLQSIVNSVKMINCLAYYETYIFDRSQKINFSNVNSINLSSNARQKRFTTETASGTATIIYSDRNKIALLTCAHILDFPDTLITYYNNQENQEDRFIESISIKTRQSNLLPELTNYNRVSILAMDSNQDIAIVGFEDPSWQTTKFQPVKFNLGHSNELDWATKVYIIGYPLNNKMITTGLTSPPAIKGKDYFFVDAVFNRGFSGGVVFAVRDGAPNFELVGMVKSGTIHREFILRPETNTINFKYIPSIPYDGEIFIEENPSIKYGVTKIMRIESITDFIEEKNSELEQQYYFTDNFFNN